MIKIRFLWISGLLMLLMLVNCRTSDEVVQIENTNKKFAVFSEESRYGKNSNFEYSKAFTYLMHRYDQMQGTNVSGLVNTTNKTVWNEEEEIYFPEEIHESYVEFRIHSQTIEDENGDIWVMFPKIENDEVKDLVVSVLTNNETEVYYPVVDRGSKIYTDNLHVFQNAYDTYFKTYLGNGKTNKARCGFDGSPACDIEVVIISYPGNGDPSNSGGGIIGGTGGGGEGGNCEPHAECLDYQGGSGGGGVSNPCEKAKSASENATTNSKKSDFATAKTAVTGMNNGLENGVVFGNVGGQMVHTDVQTGGATSGNLTHSYADPIADLHNHTDNKPPSAGDVYQLIKNQNDYANYSTRYVVTQNGTMYALVVTDKTAMNTFLSNYPASQLPGHNPNFPGQMFEDWYNFTFDGHGNAEMALSHVLDKYNTGIALTKMDTNGNFKKVNVTQNSNGTYTQSNCP
ncbi:MAG: hypothetical protein QM564_03550 [Bergeyella sp.]